jgi:hypothetical protein
MSNEWKKYNLDELSKMYGNAMENSLQRNRASGEFKRRELFWIRFTAIVAIASLTIMGAAAIGTFTLEYL